MAEFNPVGLPPLSDTGVPDMTSVSRGTGPDRTFESLFSGLTQTLDDFTKAKDTQTQLDIRDEADTMFQKVNSEYGLDVPDGVSGGLDQIQTLQNALQQGKISEVNYYGRLATLSKQLRSKYPGYDQVVDATIQSVTGTRPANAYRDAIFSAIAKAGSDASDTEKFQRNYEKTYGGQIALLFPDYFDNPGKYDFQEVQSAVSKFQAKSAGIKAQKEELSLMSSRNSFNVTRAKNVMDQDFAMITQSAMSNAVNANDPSFEQRLNQIAAAGGGSKQDIESFIGSITQA